MNLATIPANHAFLDTIARRWLAQAGDDPFTAAKGLILLPTRRAARGLREAFLRVTEGAPLLLPRLEAIGAPDEMPFALRDAFELPPAISAPLRLAQLTRLVLAMGTQPGVPASADRAWPLAQALARLLDEAARAEIDLPRALAKLEVAEFAHHWQAITQFLDIVTRQWPRHLAANQLTDAAERQVALLRAEAERWDSAPPGFPIWAVGSTGGIGAVARLLTVVARLPQGMVVLPGLDTAMPAAAWDALEEGHPQSGLHQLLARMGAKRADVAEWAEAETAPAARLHALQLAQHPAAFIASWRETRLEPLNSLHLIEPADPQEEALAIALALREGLNTPGRRCALITPDRALAARVAQELGRFGVVADDSAGEMLAQTPPGLLLRLIVAAVESGLRPVALLALLKHPLASFGLAPAQAREAARALELAALRGPAPAPWIAGLRARLAERKPNTLASELLARLENALQPLLALFQRPAIAPEEFLRILLQAAEAVATTGEDDGAARLWAMEEGEALSALLAELIPAFGELPPQDRGALPGLLAAALEGVTVRSRRALRAGDGQSEHPRIFIWGLLEARLQQADLAVLGGLVEGVWPPAADPGPWMNRKMRQQAGLPSPEEAVTGAAHDFIAAAAGAPTVILSVPARRDGAPTVPARFITRLRALLEGQKLQLAPHACVDWARALDHPLAQQPATPPAPKPPLSTRPKQFSVTDAELWFNDPYGFYAKKILNLKKLDPLEQDADHADFGDLVHDALAQFYRAHSERWPEDAAERLDAMLAAAMESKSLRAAIREWWRPRLRRIAGFIDHAERARREHLHPLHRAYEIKGQLRLMDDYILDARADRIERVASADGEGSTIIDYKTGSAPAKKQVLNGQSPQLPLEGMMLQRGGFGEELAGETHALEYWRISGGRIPGEVITIKSKHGADQRAETEELCERAYQALCAQIAIFANSEQPYLSVPDPSRMPRYSDYAALSRRDEWAALDDEAEDSV